MISPYKNHTAIKIIHIPITQQLHPPLITIKNPLNHPNGGDLQDDPSWSTLGRHLVQDADGVALGAFGGNHGENHGKTWENLGKSWENLGKPRKIMGTN